MYSNANTKTEEIKDNKVCLFEPKEDPTYVWISMEDNNIYTPNFTISSYMSVPFLMVTVDTGYHLNFGEGSKPIPNLKKISDEEFWYAAHDKVWKITKGKVIYSIERFDYSEVCFE